MSLALQARGPSTAQELAHDLDVSQPTISRHLAKLSSGKLERIGRGRATRYGLRRDVRGLGTSWPIHRIGDDGTPSEVGKLHALFGGYRVAPAVHEFGWLENHHPDGLFGGLPFFLHDVAPQGYVGRALAREVSAQIHVPADPTRWTDDDILAFLVNAGSDLPGDLVVGDQALARALRSSGDERSMSIARDRRLVAFPERAEAAAHGATHGSSAGGDQPKFLATLREAESTQTSILVKFSAADDSPVSRRWADLLLCEHLAAEVIASRGRATSQTELLESQPRRFLQITRFDRTPIGGRRGLISLSAIKEAFVDGPSDDWVTAAQALEQADVVSAADATELRWRWCFGDLIANSDMHPRNTSLFVASQLPFALAPSYDMLPMLFAPGNQGDLTLREFAPQPPLPRVSDVWNSAADAAIDFWRRVETHAAISPNFAAIAGRARVTVEKLALRFGKTARG